jgi:hypothetical protein
MPIGSWRGKPPELPTPKKFETPLKLKTAKARVLGLTRPRAAATADG